MFLELLKTLMACWWMSPGTANAQATCSAARVLRPSARPSSRPAQITHLLCVRRHDARVSDVPCSRSCSQTGLSLSPASMAATKKSALPPSIAAQLGNDLRSCYNLCARLPVAFAFCNLGILQLNRVAPYVNRSEWLPCKRTEAHRINGEEVLMQMAVHNL